MPALNEEDNILLAIDNTLTAFRKNGVTGEIIVINDGSTDSTADLVKRKIEENPGIVRMIEHNTPEGIGASFWDGVSEAKGEIVCMLPGDDEGEPSEIIRYTDILKDVDIIIPFVYNKWVRSAFRNFISSFFVFIINTTFGTKLNYTNGSVLYRKSILLTLECQSRGFFYQTDILIRLIKRGYLFAEVPYSIGKRKFGKTKALSFSNFFCVLREYLILVKDIYFSTETKLCRTKFTDDSISSKRYQNNQ